MASWILLVIGSLADRGTLGATESLNNKVQVFSSKTRIASVIFFEK